MAMWDGGGLADESARPLLHANAAAARTIQACGALAPREQTLPTLRSTGRRAPLDLLSLSVEGEERGENDDDGRYPEGEDGQVGGLPSLEAMEGDPSRQKPH